MSCHKSPERMQSDMDKAIRKERWERKRQERDERRKLRKEKQRVRESIAKNGVPGVQFHESSFGFWDAIHHDALTCCESCNRVLYESRMMGDICEQCFYSKEAIRDEGLKSETQRDAPEADRLTATGKSLEVPPSGQLKLEL